MKVLNGYSKISRSSVLTIGNFDGVHKGHQEIIKKAVDISKRKKINSIVITFKPHPIEFFKKNSLPFRLTNDSTKINEIESLGADYLIFMRFNKNLNRLSPEDFIKRLIKFKPKFIVVGYNFRFGYKRTGDTKILQKFAKEHSYKLIVVKPVLGKNKKLFNSTYIRKKIQTGNYDIVKEMLGRNLLLEGKIIKGSGRGEKLGYKTANFILNKYIEPMKGVYITKSYFDNKPKKKYYGLANIGNRPTFNGKKVFFENHFFNFTSILYGKKIFVELLAFLRKEKKFANIELLKKQIKSDVLLAKKFLNKNK